MAVTTTRNGRRRHGVGLLVAIQLVLVTATGLRPGNLGEPTWHHVASLGAVLVGVAAWWWMAARRGAPLHTDRAHLGIWVLIWTVLATTSGFLILYLKQDLKDWGLKDWAKAWHILWSWAAALYFFQHTWINRAGLGRAWGLLHRAGSRVRTAATVEAPWLLIGVAIAITWAPSGHGWFTESNYIPMTLWTWIVIVAPSYLTWGVTRWLGRAGRGRLPRPIRRPAVQAFTDVWLVVAAALATLSGIPITFFGTKETTAKYVAKYWHTWPSILFAVLVFAHTMHFWSGMRSHWKTRRQ